MNLSCMGAKAEIVKCTRGKTHMGALVTFGVKFLKADILVQTLFTPKGERYPKFICEGFNSKKELYRFTKWIKLDELPEECHIPDWLDGTLSPKHCNIEFVDGKVIEVHPRHSTDFPENATTIIPIWADSDQQDHHSGAMLVTHM